MARLCCLKTVFDQPVCLKCPSDHKTTHTKGQQTTNTQTQRRAGKRNMRLRINARNQPAPCAAHFCPHYTAGSARNTGDVSRQLSAKCPQIHYPQNRPNQSFNRIHPSKSSVQWLCHSIQRPGGPQIRLLILTSSSAIFSCSVV